MIIIAHDCGLEAFALVFELYKIHTDPEREEVAAIQPIVRQAVQ